MKKQIPSFVGLIIVLTISCVTAIHAQSATTTRAHIPFDFSVRNQAVSAGDYLVRQQDNKGVIWSLQNARTGRQVIMLVMHPEAKRSSGTGKLTFRRYGNKYFLAGIETPAYTIGIQKSRDERSLQKVLENNRLAKTDAGDAKPEIVTVETAM